MDRRSWPWKKKSSDKAAADKVIATLESAVAPSAPAGSQGDQGKQDNHKKTKYVQISVESYTHLTGLEDQLKSYEDQVQSYEDQVQSYEDQVKTYEDQVQSYEDQVKALEDEVEELKEKLAAANSELTTKESLVKQHAKVAEEAVSGWEKAEAEALALKNHLESVTLLKLTAEDRASHLDGALKECMRQIRNLKEEHEQKLHEVVLTKTQQCDMIKLELETQLGNLEQELLRSASDNAAISRSLQERSNMLIKISEEKSQAEAEIELLKSNIESCDREINSLKYELHIVAKELEIRNEEKNMSVRSAEVANKQHLEGAKKIAKLEAECQRLRGLVRKKLPGPAALAQMKLEVESLGRDHGESRLRRSPVKPPTSPHMSQLTEFSLDSVQKYHKDYELLTERLLAMEEETKMLKEALAKRNSELQASRSVCAKTVSKLQSLEAQLQASNQHRGITKSNIQVSTEGSFSQNASNPPSLTSMSEDGNDDELSCAGSWATALISELAHVKKEKNIDSPREGEKSNQLELMDDFLEMEKLAYSSSDPNGAVSISDISNSTKSEVVNHDLAGDATTTDLQLKEQLGLKSLETKETLDGEDPMPFLKLQSRISMEFESISGETDMEKLLKDIRHVVEDMHDSLHQNSVSSSIQEPHCSDAIGDHQACPVNSEVTAGKELSLYQDSQELAEPVHTIGEELAAAVSQIHDYVVLLGKEAKAVQGTSLDAEGLSQKLEEFSATFNEVLNCKVSLTDFVLCLSQVFSEASYFRFDVLGYKNIIEAEAGSSDCIDKVALPENNVVRDSSGETYANGCAHFSDSTSDPDIPHEGSFVPTSELKTSSRSCSLEEFELLKSEKDNIMIDLARSTENLEITKSQLQETEQLLAEVKSQLASARKMNGLAETQLKCMAESYKSLETRAEELQVEVNLLRAKTETLDNEIQEERRSHQDALARCKDLQEELQRIESCPDADIDAKSSREKELAAAAEKLAECQETIFLLGKQLKLMRPQTEFGGSPSRERTHKGESFAEDKLTTSSMNLLNVDISEMDSPTSANMHRVGSESPINIYNTPFSPSDSEANNLLRSPVSSKNPNHRPTTSGSSSSSSSSSNPTPEKQSRGFSRFFSTKTKNDH